MTISVLQSATAIIPGSNANFSGVGGTGEYFYEVAPGGAGGIIDSSGNYSAPANPVITAQAAVDTIIVTDIGGTNAYYYYQDDIQNLPSAKAQILVGSPLFLLAEIIQSELQLDSDHIYFWNQKLNEPKDAGLYVVLSVSSSRPLGNVNRHTANGASLNSTQFLNVIDTVEIDIISRSAAARDQRNDVLLALNSDYSQNQQSGNGFSIARLPGGGRFINLSGIDGALIPYRFRLSIALQYAYMKTAAVDYFDSLGELDVVANSESPGADDLIYGGTANPLPIIITGGGA